MQQWKERSNSTRSKNTKLVSFWGKTTFNQISNDYILNHKPHNFKTHSFGSNKKQRAKTQEKKLRYIGMTKEQTMLSKEYTQQSNLKLTHNTWDAKHLDIFLSNSKWGQACKRNIPDQFPNVHFEEYSQENSGEKLPQEKVGEDVAIDASGIQQHVNLSSTGQVRSQAPFFKIQQRWDEKAKNFVAYPAQMNDLNVMVSNIKVDEKDMKKYYNNFLLFKKINYDKSKINLLDQPVKKQHPLQRMKEMQSVKRNNKLYRSHKDEFLWNKIKLKNHRTRQKNGILGIDNPTLPNTLIYKEEYSRRTRKQNAKNKINRRFSENIKKRRQTHNNITFLNKEPKKLNVKKQGKFLKSKETHRWYMAEQEPVWYTKRRIGKMSNLCSLSTTHRNIFEPITDQKFQFTRAKYLRTQDKRKVDYNITSNIHDQFEMKIKGKRYKFQ